ncbi:MAG: class I SAM-dependent methyltransferase [Acidobacteriota bacterium]|nr:class I SAM-dependent methyltransferase [Acidobacteriota bacterium]
MSGRLNGTTLSVVDVRIKHCPLSWAYRERAFALALAKALRERFGAKVEITAGAFGQFDVYVDGKLVVSRGQSLLVRITPSRLPNAVMVIAAVERYLSTGEANLDLAKAGHMGREFGPEDAKRFYDRFGSKQDVQFYERVALKDLVAHAGFEHASAVFELGCGTGRFAASLFEKHLAADACYLGVDISTAMTGIATRRLAPWSGRFEVRQADGTTSLLYPDGAFDRFVATYVLDLLPEAAIKAVLAEAHRLLTPQGKLCLVTSTEGIDTVSRLLCSAWKRVHAFNPRLVGGCRPLRAAAFLDPGAWRIEHTQIISSWGICSEVVIAAPV